MDDELYGMLIRLIAVSPEGDGAINAMVRDTCGRALSLPALPADEAPADDPAVAGFAEQFAIDVASLTPAQRASFTKTLGAKAFGITALIFVADYVPRVQAALAAL